MTKAGPLDDASNLIEKVDDQPQQLPAITGPVTDLPLAVFKISRTRPPLGLPANEG